MAKRKTTELSPEAVAANLAGEAVRQNEKAERARNSEKQKRYRENMKAQGFKQVLLWGLPCPADVQERMITAGFRQVPAWKDGEGQYVRGSYDSVSPDMVFAAVPIHEKAIKAAVANSAIQKALESTISAFWGELEKSGLPKKERDNLYIDFKNYIKVLGYAGY